MYSVFVTYRDVVTIFQLMVTMYQIQLGATFLAKVSRYESVG